MVTAARDSSRKSKSRVWEMSGVARAMLIRKGGHAGDGHHGD